MRVVFLVFCLMQCCLRAQFLATYSFAAVTGSSGATDPSPLPEVQGLELRSFRALNLSASSSASARFAFTGWPAGATHQTDDWSAFTGALSGLHYYEMSMVVQPGYTLQLESLSFGVRRSGTGPRNYALRGSLENFSSNLPASAGNNGNMAILSDNTFFWRYDSLGSGSDQKGSQVLPGAAYQGIDDSVTIRIYAWNAEAGGGSFSVDNFSVLGRTFTLIDDMPSRTLCDPLSARIVPQRDGNYLIDWCGRVAGLALYGSDGRPVRSFAQNTDAGTVIDLSGLPANLYFLVCSRGPLGKIVWDPDEH